MEISLNELLYQVSFALDCVEHDLVGVATNHSKRVACVGLEIGARLGLNDSARSDLAGCAVLHDNALTEYILSERMRGSTPSVRLENLRGHCALGEENASGFPFLGDVSGVIRYHHENADGSGCFGKAASEIPLGAAIIRLADGLDLLFHLGRGEPSMSEVAEHVRGQRGRLYDRDVADAFLELAGQGLRSRLEDAEIDRSLRALTPAATIRCTNGELLRIARVFAKIIDYKSPFTRRHSLGIADKAGRMAARYGYTEDESVRLVLAAALHDIGKLATSTVLLEKPGKLTPEEYAEVKQHVRYTHEMLQGVSGFEEINAWAAAHHEKLDGSGYPFGKTAGQLDRNARLLACIDIYQALTEDRPYRPGMSHREAMEILRRMAERGQLDSLPVRDLDDEFASETSPVPFSFGLGWEEATPLPLGG